jgi:hypothetical protein
LLTASHLNRKVFITLLVFILATLTSGVAYFVLIKKYRASIVPSSSPPPINQISVTPTIPVEDQPSSATSFNYDNNSGWKLCRNTKFGYEVQYPPNWKVWRPGAPEVRPATCAENLPVIAFSPDIYDYGTDHKQITIYTVVRANSLQDYFDESPEILRHSSVLKETTLDKEKLIWLEGGWLLSYHNGYIFDFRVENIDDSTLNKFFQTFRFIR